MILTFLAQKEPHRRQAALWPWRSSPSERLPMQPGGVATLHGTLTAQRAVFSGKMGDLSKACKVISPVFFGETEVLESPSLCFVFPWEISSKYKGHHYR